MSEYVGKHERREEIHKPRIVGMDSRDYICECPRCHESFLYHDALNEHGFCHVATSKSIYMHLKCGQLLDLI